jgi:hypothetical protein
MMKVFLVLYQFSLQAGFSSEAPTGVILQFPTEEACLEAVALFNSIGQGSDVHYAPESLVLRAECKATNPAVKE